MSLTIFRRGSPAGQAADARLDLGADDLRRLVEIERGQRLLLQNAYEDTVVALARAYIAVLNFSSSPSRWSIVIAASCSVGR